MKELNVKTLRFDCQCPNCKKWWSCDKDDLKSRVVDIQVMTHPGHYGSPTHPSRRTRYYVNCAKCKAEIIVGDVHPALKEYVTENTGK